jgi:hypothetical protein
MLRTVNTLLSTDIQVTLLSTFMVYADGKNGGKASTFGRYITAARLPFHMTSSLRKVSEMMF